jgi:magnesium transporter
MKTPYRKPDLHNLLKHGRQAEHPADHSQSHPALRAEKIAALPPSEAWEVLRQIPLPSRSEVFAHLGPEQQAQILDNINRTDMALLLSDMPPDDRADFFKRMPEDKRDAILPALARAEREDIRRLAAYKEGTAGAVMTSEYATLSPNMTASQAIERLREVAPDKETIYYAYVLDAHRKLIGFVSLKDLILARRAARINDIMHKDIIYTRVDTDQEDAARTIQKYDLIALPVTNGNDALVGIITHDDAIDIITQEHTEDMEKFMAIAGSHEAAVYMRTSAWGHFKNRSGWIVALAMLGIVSGFIVQSFEGLLLQFAILAAFMPMMADTGGNTGSQAATLVVRALALREISPRDVVRVLAKEIQVALLLALLLGIVAYGRVAFFGGGSTIPDEFSLSLVGVAIATALGLQVLTATLIGAVLPLAAARVKVDPAVMASPALTTIVDITGLLIYFTTVKFILGI